MRDSWYQQWTGGVFKENQLVTRRLERAFYTGVVSQRSGETIMRKQLTKPV